MDTALILDDDKAIVKLLEKVMNKEDFVCEHAYNGKEGLDKIKSNQYAIILLDINMPYIDGFQLLENLRENGNNTPVIIISGNLDDYAALYGLEIGADNFITKPFNPRIVAAKAKALVNANRRINETKLLQEGPFSFNPETMVIMKNQERLSLSAKEVLMMKFFLENIDRVFTKEALYSQLWGNVNVDKNSIMVYINHLRNKIEDDPKNPKFLNTIWGTGYCFSIPK